MPKPFTFHGWHRLLVVMFLDGLDTQAISYMAPTIAKEWGLSREVLGPIFSSALAGLLLGYCCCRRCPTGLGIGG